MADRYELLRVLGSGAFGTVYEAIDRKTDARVAVKELNAVDPTDLTRFKQEFRLACGVCHENLVRLDALFESDGRWMIAMELVPGDDLLGHLVTTDTSLRVDETQLRRVFGQLLEGLRALHAAGVLHRDLKPANVRITPTGRVVLLDFGLMLAVDSRTVSLSPAGAGTLAYMAPEQLTQRKVSPAADFYAFGVCLYEAMTGQLPVDASSHQELMRLKQDPGGPAALPLHPDLPADLCALCRALLSPDPTARPDADHIGAVLLASAGRARAESSDAERDPVFVGRKHELGVLEGAFERALQGASQLVVLEGESGIGKSALIEHFACLPREALRLRSRCYENELVPYKAFDGAVDTLASVMRRLPARELAPLLPPNAVLLGRLFPVLQSIKALARGEQTHMPANPTALRVEAFGVFAQLLARLGQRTTVLLCVDDLQWADAESLRLLHACALQRQARVLIVASVRPRGELSALTAGHLRDLLALEHAQHLPMGGLPLDNARELAGSLMDAAPSDAGVERIVAESHGHPLLMTVLVRAARAAPELQPNLTLDAAIVARVEQLAPEARALLELAAVAGAPLSASTLGQAAGLEAGEFARLSSELLRQRLLRRRGMGELACFHDRIRDVTSARLSPDRLRDCHAQLSKALAEHGDADLAQLARHCDGAGEVRPAYAAYRAAAAEALASLAFERASMLYARCVELAQALEIAPGERALLLSEQGHALARGGRSAEAARAYLQAAQLLSPAEQPALRMLGAQHLMQAGCTEEGMRAARELLAEIDAPLPATRPGALLRTLLDRSVLAFSGTAPRTRATRIDPRARLQLDALSGLALPLLWLDPLASAALSSRYSRLARRAGDPGHLARALAEEALSREIEGGSESQADALLARARTLFSALGDPALDVSVSFYEGATALLRWQLPRSRERLEHAHQVCVERCPQDPWLLTNVRITLGGVAVYLGDHTWLAQRTRAWLDESRDRDDRFALALLEGYGYGFIRNLMADDPALARSRADAELSCFPASPFSFAHYGQLNVVAQSALYAGGPDALRWFDQERTRLDGALLLKLPFGRATLLLFRASAAIAACEDRTSSERAQLLARARLDLQQLTALGRRRVRTAYLHGLALEAQLHALEGNRERALTVARDARARSEELGYAYLWRCCQHFEGLLEGGDSGADKQRQATAFFAEQGWKKPQRAVSIWCPAARIL